MRALCYAQTNIGSGRDNNEDNYYCNGTFKRDPAIPVAEAAAEQESKRLIYGVFDGMGGEANGGAGGAIVRADAARVQQRRAV